MMNKMLDNLTTIYDPKGFYIKNTNILGTRIGRASPNYYVNFDKEYCNKLLSIGCKLVQVICHYHIDVSFTYYVITDFGGNNLFEIAKALETDLIVDYYRHSLIIQDDYY